MLAPLCPASPDSRQAGESPEAPAPGGAAPWVWGQGWQAVHTRATFSDGEGDHSRQGCLWGAQQRFTTET